MEKTLFQIIASSGESKSKVFEALEAYQKGDNKAKNRLLQESEELLTEANKSLFGLVKKEVNGEKIPFSILLIHSCDILMSTVTVRELITKLTEKGDVCDNDQ